MPGSGVQGSGASPALLVGWVGSPPPPLSCARPTRADPTPPSATSPLLPPRVCLPACLQGTTLKQAALALGHCSEAEFDAWVRPEDMIAPK